MEKEISVVKPQMNPTAKAYQIPSAVYNGDVMSKIDVMIYLRDVISLKKEIDQCMQKREERNKRLRVLEVEKKRRPVAMMPEMQKPTGLSALIPGKQKAYEKWLSDASQRETQKKCLEDEENQRVALLEKEYSSIVDENFKENSKMFGMVEQYKELLLRQIIAPDYRKVEILETLLMLLFNNRAQTLTEAINLYHEEQHRLTMQNLAEQQKQQIELAKQEQMRMVWQQMEMQREQMQKIAKAAEAAENAAKEAKYYAELDFLMNLDL